MLDPAHLREDRNEPGDADSDLVTQRYFVADALRRRGWTDDAIRKVLSNVDFAYYTDRLPGNRSTGYATFNVVPQDPNSRPYITLATNDQSKPTDSAGIAYEHEAHHAWDHLSGLDNTQGAEAVTAPEWQQYALAVPFLGDVLRSRSEVFQDLASLRDWSRSTQNDRLNRVVTALVNKDPSVRYYADAPHANHLLSILFPQDQLPSWYREKYFGYLRPEGRLLRQQDAEYNRIDPEFREPAGVSRQAPLPAGPPGAPLPVSLPNNGPS